ncbi:hypothetical protein ACQZ6F_30140 [Rhizobium sp. A22-96]
MHLARLRFSVLVMILAVPGALGAVNPAYAYSVYRAVTADARSGVVIWYAANFGVSGNPPSLTFFHFPNDDAARAAIPNAQCLVKMDLGNLVAPVVGKHVPVGNAAIPVNASPSDNPRAFPWSMTFNNNPPGHWSVAKTEIQNPPSTNAAASRVAAAGFQSLATASGSGVTVINGYLHGCRAQ